MASAITPASSGNSPRRILFASLIGTTIEFFDFYIFATAAVLVFPRMFFPSSDPASATLASLATSAIALAVRQHWLRRCSRWVSPQLRLVLSRPTAPSAWPRQRFSHFFASDRD